MLLPRRRSSLRCPGFDYRTEGVYFVTCCTHGRVPLFGRLSSGDVVASRAGEVVRDVWRELPQRVPKVGLDAFVLMPDHIHAVIVIGVGAAGLSEAVRAFKALSARRINALGLAAGPGHPVWQRGFFDQIVRSPRHLDAVRRYIDANPRRAMCAR